MSPLTPAPKGYPIKIVRDGTAAIVNPSGEPGDLWYDTPPAESEEEIVRLLRLKLSEEVGEYLIDGTLDELADVLAVIEALAVYEGSNLKGLTAKMQDDPRGGFLKAVMMYGRHPEYDR
jgi:predicted house-cleaning noncanonical NTP pyrophosphatase (MazG superfamily)